MLAYYQGWNQGMVKILHGNISHASRGCDSEPKGRSQSTYCLTKKTCHCYTKSFFVRHRFTTYWSKPTNIGSCKLHNWSIKGQESDFRISSLYSLWEARHLWRDKFFFSFFFLFLYKIEILFLSNLSVYVYKASSWKLEPRPLHPYPTSTCEVTITTRVYGGVAGQILNKDNQVKGLPIEFKHDEASLNALILCLRTIFGIG